MCSLPRLLAALGVLSFFPAVLSLTLGFPYGSQKVRGVNLGGWLVLEVYILQYSLLFNLNKFPSALDYTFTL
jgi:glucan 1,3-beta-glucosidase